METYNRAIESFINNGGAVGEAQQALARGNKVASIGVSAGVTVANASVASASAIASSVASGTTVAVAGGAVTTSVAGALTAVQGVLATAGVTASVPVIGWVIAGVLVVGAGAMTIGAKRRAKWLSKDRKLLEKLINRYKGRTSDQRLREAKKQISMIQFLLTMGKTKRNLKRRAKAELKLEALYFIAKQERMPILEQQAQLKILVKNEALRKKQIIIAVPIAIILLLGTTFLVMNRKR